MKQFFIGIMLKLISNQLSVKKVECVFYRQSYSPGGRPVSMSLKTTVSKAH